MMNIDLNEDPKASEEPFVSQTFGSEKEAQIFYKNYAERHDFAIRKIDLKKNMTRLWEVISIVIEEEKSQLN